MEQKQGIYNEFINEFFIALELRDFTQTDVILKKFYALGSSSNHYRLWASYLSGVLEQEKNNNWAEAEQIFGLVLADQPTKELEALVYLSKGIAYQRLGRWIQCLDVSMKSARLWENLEQPLRKATTLRQIAIACLGGYLSGDFEIEKLTQGRAICTEALAILKSTSISFNDGGLYAFDRELYIATTYEVLGEIENCMGDYEQASQCFQFYLDIASKRQEKFHIGLASWHLADTYQLSDLSQRQYVLSLYDTALNTFAHMQENYFEFLALAAKGTAYRKLKMPDMAIICFERSLALLETVRAGVSSESARRDFFSKLINIHSNAMLAEIDVGNVVSALNSAEFARSRTFLDALANLDIVDSEITPGFSWQKELRPDCLLLEFHCLGLLKHSGGQTNKQQAAIDVLYPGEKILLFVVTNESITAIDLNLSPNALIPSDPHKPVEEFFLDPNIRRALYDKLIAPVEHLLKDKRRVYIIPHGPLHYVPFHALIAPDGETLLRADGPEIVYAPSATILFREMKRAQEPATGTCLTVGYNGSGESELLFAEEEAQYISAMADGNALVGPTSKKEALYAQAANYQLVHFSCHGHFDPESPLESALHIAPDEVLTGREIIDNLKLNCDLVTLSACESGLSKVQRGDELYGLIRAFMYAGARAIIASLWRADERTTLIIGERFYQSLQDGASYATALKDAQIFLKNLTRREAVEILGRYLVNEQGELVVGQSKSGARLTPEIKQEAERYLTELRTKGPSSGYEIVPGADDDDKIFADPWFWAPFVLIGDPQARSRKK